MDAGNEGNEASEPQETVSPAASETPDEPLQRAEPATPPAGTDSSVPPSRVPSSSSDLGSLGTEPSTVEPSEPAPAPSPSPSVPAKPRARSKPKPKPEPEPAGTEDLASPIPAAAGDLREPEPPMPAKRAPKPRTQPQPKPTSKPKPGGPIEPEPALAESVQPELTAGESSESGPAETKPKPARQPKPKPKPKPEPVELTESGESSDASHEPSEPAAAGEAAGTEPSEPVVPAAPGEAAGTEPSEPVVPAAPAEAAGTEASEVSELSPAATGDVDGAAEEPEAEAGPSTPADERVDSTPRQHRRRTPALLASAAVVVVVLAVVGVRSDRHHHQASAATTSTTAKATTSTTTTTSLPVETTSRIIQEIDPAVVDINTINQIPTGYAIAAATGMIVSSDGYIVTNNHVVEEATSIKVAVAGHASQYKATFVGADPAADVAVIKIDGLTGLPTVQFGNSSTVDVGNQVVAIGNVHGRGGAPAVTTGTISALDRSITATNDITHESESLSGMIETSATIRAGNSGGPLVDDHAVVIGMNTAADTGGTFGYALPIDRVSAIAAAIEQGRSGGGIVLGLRAFLGVVGQPPKAGTKPTGVEISRVVENEPAVEGGIEAGDVIVDLDGTPTPTVSVLQRLVLARKPGDVVTVTFQGQNGLQTSSVTLVGGPAP